MKQQINLYQPIFHLKKNPLPATKMLLIAAVLALLMFIPYGFFAYQINGLGEKLLQVRKEGVQLTKNIDKMQALMVPKEKSQLLENEIERLTSERESKELLIGYLSACQIERSGGFSSYLEALAKQKVDDGLWLRLISFGSVVGNMTLEGSATDPQLVPRYLQHLSEDGSFNDVEFSEFRIIRSKGSEESVEFFMKTKYAGGNDEKP
jgi:hypothetical protein